MTEEEYEKLKENPISVAEYLMDGKLLPWQRVVLLETLKENKISLMRGRNQ